MKKLVMIPLEFLLVIALFSLPVFILGRSTYLELRHFLHQDIIEFILSGKLPLLVTVLVILISLIVHFSFKPDLRRIAKSRLCHFHKRKYKLGYWGTTVSNSKKHDYFHRHGFVLFFLFVLTFSLISAYIYHRVSISSRHALVNIIPFFLLCGGLAVFHFLISLFYTPYVLEKESRIKRKVHALIPAYNEPVENLEKTFESLLHQETLPTSIILVNDGSTLFNYNQLSNRFEEIFNQKGIFFKLINQENKGKRAALVTAYDALGLKESPENIIFTIDSDTTLDKKAISEGIIPFQDEQVYSVAGVIASRNMNDNLMTGIMELILVGHQQLIERATASFFGSVPVNNGPIAFYRMEVFDLAKEMKFTSETFRGQRIEFSDDSFLTACGLMLGRCVAQFSSVGYTDFPNKFSHLLRQQLRWMRGSFIRGFWRIAFFNVTSFVFWRQLLTWLTFAITTVLSMQIIVFFVTQGTFLTLLFMLIIPLILNMLLSLSYFAIHREGMQIKQKFKIFALFPLAMVWNFFVLRTIRLIGYLTHKQTGWGTREKVEL